MYARQSYSELSIMYSHTHSITEGMKKTKMDDRTERKLKWHSESQKWMGIEF